MCYPTPPSPRSPLRLILIISLRKWVCNVVLQKCAVETSQVRSAILKKCAGGIFTSAHQYLRSGYWSFYLEGLSDKSEVCTDKYQRSVDFWEFALNSGKCTLTTLFEKYTLVFQKCALMFTKGAVVCRQYTLCRLEVQSEHSGPS